MELLLKSILCGIITVILTLVIPSDRKEVKILLGVVGCCVVAAAAASYLQPLVEFVRRVEKMGNLNSQLIDILWKVVGVGILSEIVSLICKDMGNGSLAKMMQFISAASIFWLTIPLFQEFIDLIENVLERL